MSFPTDFADQMKKIGENIAVSYDARIGAVGDIFKDTHSTLRNFHTEHQHMSEEQRKELGHFRNELMNDTKRMIGDFRKEFNEMAKTMREELDRFHHTVYRETHQMLNTYHSQMNAVKNDFQKAHQAWHSISRSIQQRKGMHQIPKKMQNKGEQICSILEANPSGMTMGQIAKEMGCAPQSIRTIMNNMKKQGRISKRQNKFYCRG